MKPIQIISQDLFDKVRSRFGNLEMGGETGAVTIDPAEARFFDFDFVIEGNNLGRVSISLNDAGTLKVYYSQGITENQDDPAKKAWYSFLKEMRFFAMRRLLRFDTRDIAKTNLDKNDFQHLAATQAPKEPDMPEKMNESMWNHKSTKKTSRAVKGTTEVIVRHSRAVDEMYPGARSQRKNIKAIFIQNKDGERFKYPFIHPAGAFAMAQHVDHGGVPHDPAGKAIIKMSEQIAQLAEFQRKVSRSTLHDDATGITERAIGRLQELKARVEALGKRHHYESWMAEFSGEAEGELDGIMELDAVTMEQYKQAFTQTSFEEELTGYFPLLHRIMSETNKVDLEDYVGEDAVDENGLQYYTGKKKYKKADESFEAWAEAVEQGKLTDDEIEQLKQALAQLPQGPEGPELELGPDGQTAWQFFSGLGINDPDLEEKIKAAAEVSPDSDPFDAFKSWANENYPELLVALGVSGETEQPAEEPPAEPAAAPAEPAAAPPAAPAEPAAPEQPVAETDDDNLERKIVNSGRPLKYIEQKLQESGLASDVRQFLRWAIDNGCAYVEDAIELGEKVEGKYPEISYGLHSLKKLVGSHDDASTENEEMKGREPMMSREGVIKEVAKIVKSFYNKDNPNVGPFRGAENIALDCKKQIAEKFGNKAGIFAEKLAGEFIDKLTTEWHHKHGQVGDDGLARLKELLNNIKGRVESIGDVGGHPGNNIMSAEEGIEDRLKDLDPKNPVNIPAYQRKAKSGDSAAQANRPKESAEMESILKLAGLAK